jgi:hypothetical protein
MSWMLCIWIHSGEATSNDTYRALSGATKDVNTTRFHVEKGPCEDPREKALEYSSHAQ